MQLYINNIKTNCRYRILRRGRIEIFEVKRKKQNRNTEYTYSDQTGNKQSLGDK